LIITLGVIPRFCNILIDFCSLEELNFGINSKHLIKPIFFHPFYAFIFSYVLFLRAAVEMVFMGKYRIVQSTGRFCKHVCKVAVIKYLPLGYISI